MPETPSHPGRNLFVNIPVADLDASVAFFGDLGFTFNPLFTDETATCMLVGEQSFFMLLTIPRWHEFSDRDRADLTRQTPACYAFSVDSRTEVDHLADRAIDLGAERVGEPEDHGFMYSRAFRDLDGHHWDVMWMDPAAALDGPEAASRPETAAST